MYTTTGLDYAEEVLVDLVGGRFWVGELAAAVVD